MCDFGAFIIYNPQVAFKYAAQKSRLAATDKVFSIRHNNSAAKNAASQVYPAIVKEGINLTVHLSGRGRGACHH